MEAWRDENDMLQSLEKDLLSWYYVLLEFNFKNI